MFLQGFIPNLERLIGTWKVDGGEARGLCEMEGETDQQRKAGAQKEEELN